MSIYCERCNRTFPNEPEGTCPDNNYYCPLSPPRKVPLRYYVRSYIDGLPDLLDDIRIWLDHGESYWRYPAWWSLIILAMFCIVNVAIIFAMVIKWLWGF